MCWLNLRFVPTRCICVRTCFTSLMRLFHVVPTLGLLFGARASSLGPREPAAHPLDARDLLDVCASVNANLEVPNLLGVLTAVGVIGRSIVPLVSSDLDNNFDRYLSLSVGSAPFSGD